MVWRFRGWKTDQQNSIGPPPPRDRFGFISVEEREAWLAARDVNHPFHFSPFISPFYLPDSSVDLSTLSSGELKEEEKEGGWKKLKEKGEKEKGGNGKRAESWSGFFARRSSIPRNLLRTFFSRRVGNRTRGILNLIKSATRWKDTRRGCWNDGMGERRYVLPRVSRRKTGHIFILSRE